MTPILLLLLHVGSPDVFYEGAAGPYHALVTIRPPQVIPGVAEIDVRADADVTEVKLTPMPLSGEGAEHPPTPDRAVHSGASFTGRLWLMQAGSWQVRIGMAGARGPAELSVPVPALPQRMRGMQRGMALGLGALGLLLVVALASIAAASVREGQLDPGVEAPPQKIRLGRVVAIATGAVILGLLWVGHLWWNAEESDYAAYVYKPLQLETSVEGGNLELRLHDPGWLRMRKVNDLVPDHDHLMHLFVVREPDLDRMWHLHPAHSGPGVFTMALPAMPPGRYRLFADIVHRSGLAETAVTELNLPAAIAGAPGDPDDAGGPDPSSTIVWDRDGAPTRAGEVGAFRFHAAGELEPYMGMFGHAAFVRRDFSVFAHVHPTGSVPMASLMLANKDAGHSMHAMGNASQVSFPYAFPKPGDYRIFVQVKRGGRVETGVFDTHVE